MSNCDLQCKVNGVDWFLYMFEYKTADGTFSAHFYAISDEHAQLVMQELKETAELKGRLHDVIPLGGHP
jgi:hypothetical protein